VAVLAVLVAIVWTGIVVFANGMSDAPSAGFQGGWTISVVWFIAVLLVGVRLLD
jgi:hypothetical protein